MQQTATKRLLACTLFGPIDAYTAFVDFPRATYLLDSISHLQAGTKMEVCVEMLLEQEQTWIAVRER